MSSTTLASAVAGYMLQSFAESLGHRRRLQLAVDSRLTSDEGGVTSSDCETWSRSAGVTRAALRQRRTVDVVDADLISYARPLRELRPSPELMEPCLLYTSPSPRDS